MFTGLDSSSVAGMCDVVVLDHVSVKRAKEKLTPNINNEPNTVRKSCIYSWCIPDLMPMLCDDCRNDSPRF